MSIVAIAQARTSDTQFDVGRTAPIDLERALHGLLRSDQRSRAELFALAGVGR